MDPQQTWTDMLEALERKQWEPAKQLADALYEWLKKGGFPPTTFGDKSIGKRWHYAIAQFVCLAIASKAHDVEKQGNAAARPDNQPRTSVRGLVFAIGARRDPGIEIR